MPNLFRKVQTYVNIYAFSSVPSSQYYIVTLLPLLFCFLHFFYRIVIEYFLDPKKLLIFTTSININTDNGPSSVSEF